MRNLCKKMYSPSVFDGLFATSGILALVGIVLSTSRAYPAIAATAHPLVKGASIIGVVLAACLVSAVMTRHDLKHADDYLYQALCKYSIIGIVTSLCALAFWSLLFAPMLGGLSTVTTTGMVVASWSLAYFYTRVRGTVL